MPMDGTLDAEIHQRIAKASIAFGRLEESAKNRGITVDTKLCVYDVCVLTALLYGSETWTTYLRHIKLLERFHQNYLRKILNIKHVFFVYYENADLVYDVIRMRQLSKQTLHELSPNDNS